MEKSPESEVGNYDQVDDQARLMTKTLWEARFWSVMTGACAVAAIAFLIAGGFATLPVLAALGSIAGAVFCKFKSDETNAEYDILAHAVAAQQESSRFFGEMARQNEKLMEKENQLEMLRAQQDIDAMERRDARRYDSHRERLRSEQPSGSHRGDWYAEGSPPRESRSYSDQFSGSRRGESDSWSSSIDDPVPSGGRYH